MEPGRAEKRHLRESYFLEPDQRPAIPGLTVTFRARNASHHMEMEFADHGIWILPRSSGPLSWEWWISWAKTRPGVVPGGVGRVEVKESRLTRRRGAFVEWFVNSEKGLEHGFRLPEPDPGQPRTAYRELELGLEGNLTRKLRPGGQRLDLLLGGEPVLEFGELQAVDARGERLTGWLELAGGPGDPPAALLLVLDVGRATYPVTVSGLWTSPKSDQETPLSEAGLLEAVPANDACEAAEIIPAAGPFPHLSTLVPDISDATTTGDPPLPSCQTNVSRSLWYKFTPQTTEEYVISTCSGAPTGTTVSDTVIAIYTNSQGDSCAGGFTEIPAATPYNGCDDDSCITETLQSSLTTQLDAGVTYFILVWKFGTKRPPPNDAAVQLRVEQASPPPPPPPHDECAGAEVIPSAGPFPYLTATTSDIAGATESGDPPAPSCAMSVSRSIWYEFTPSMDSHYTFSSCADAPTATTVDDTVIGIYTSSDDTCGGTITQETDACDDDGCGDEPFQAVATASLSAGTKYYVVVWQNGSEVPGPGNRSVQLRVSQSFPPPPPPNDECLGAEVIPPGPYPVSTSVTADVTSATTADDPPAEPACGGTSRSRSVWYEFTPLETASYTLSTCSGDGTATTLNDTVLALYASSTSFCDGTMTPVAGGCDDDGCSLGEQQSRVTMTLDAGTTYFVLVWQKGVGIPTPGSTAVQLQISQGSLAPSNDACAGAEEIPDGPYPVLSPVTGDITGASLTGDPETASCQADRSRGVWYRFTPSASEYYRISTCADAPTGTTVDDTVLSVYRSAGGCGGPFVELPSESCEDGCDDDSCVTESRQAVLTTYLERGIEHYVVVWKFGALPPVAGHTAVQVSVDRLPFFTAPPNDDCIAAEVIPGAGPFPHLTSTAADVRGATCLGDPPGPTCSPWTSRSVWYEFTPTFTGDYTFSLCADCPTGTTVDDTVVGVYESPGGCAGPFTQVGCNDDGCVTEPGQSAVADLRLTGGQTYYAVAWQFGTELPSAGDTAVQLEVSGRFTPDNDTCAGAEALSLGVRAVGTTESATNDHELSDPGCFAGLGQTTATTPGNDVVYTFTAPASGEYAFTAREYAVSFPYDLVAYVASECPSGVGPQTVGGCLGASNRTTGGSSEEVSCLPLVGGQTVYVYVDDAIDTSPGSAFTVEVVECVRETEPNGTPAEAGNWLCGLGGSIDPAGDVDFYSLGSPLLDERVFALVDGVSATSNDFDLRVTTATETLEYDDLNNDGEFGNLAPNVAGTAATGEPLYLRVSHYSSSTASEPYRLYAVVQPPLASAPFETEPNNTPATANVGDYFYAGLPGPEPSADVDLYRFDARAGEVVFVSLDGDPTYDDSPVNAKLEILDSAGGVMLTVNDNGSSSSPRTPASGLTATSPTAPGEALAFGAPVDGTYYVRVSVGTTGVGSVGDYLLSIAPGCLAADADDDTVPNVTDCVSEDPAFPTPDDGTCDAFDDDCDFLNDDDYVPPPTSCGVGICTGNAGLLECQAGALVDTCDPLEGASPDDSLCDGLDNDCDGPVDEEYVSLPTTCGVGACFSTGVTSCPAGVVEDSCTPGPPLSTDDTTCDSIDDDCDGVNDDDYVPPPTSCGVGACSGNTGQLQCQAGSLVDTCDPFAGAAVDDATCDGVDDDCDGLIDEEFVAPEAGPKIHFTDAVTIAWTGPPGSPTYNLYRGGFGAGAFSYDHTCSDPGIAVEEASVPEEPTLGLGFYYLLAIDSDCGEGGLGDDSSGVARPKPTPCP